MFPSPLPSAWWQDLIGVPFEVGARGPDSLDCWGLLATIYERAGVPLPSFPSPTTPEGFRALERALTPLWDVSPIIPGAALLFRDGLFKRHVGVALDDDLFIHASEGRRQVCLDYLSRGHSPALLGSYLPNKSCN